MPNSAERRGVFYGWWIVFGCIIVAVVGWSLAIFGMGVYVHLLSERGFSVSSISSAVTLSYLISAACVITVGKAIARLGPQLVTSVGVTILAASLVGIALCDQIWQVFFVFALLGVGRPCLSATSISTILAPWFERHQGRAISTALLGASIGGMIGTPLLLASVSYFGIKLGFVLASGVSLVAVLPITLFLLKPSPQAMGLLPDGDVAAPGISIKPASAWTLKAAVRTRQFQTQLIAFSLALMVQIGFLSHHVSIIAQTLGESAASFAVSSAALAAFLGRIALASFADRVDVRWTTATVLTVGSLALGAMATTTSYSGLIFTSVAYGFTVGNVTTLSPIVVRREFGAASFGSIYGLAAAAIGFSYAFGPALFGVLRDAFGSYSAALALAALLNIAAAIIIVWGGQKVLAAPH